MTKEDGEAEVAANYFCCWAPPKDSTITGKALCAAHSAALSAVREDMNKVVEKKKKKCGAFLKKMKKNAQAQTTWENVPENPESEPGLAASLDLEAMD